VELSDIFYNNYFLDAALNSQMNLSKYLFWFVLLVCILSFLNRNNYRNVNDIEPAVLSGPILEEPNSNYPIEISSKGLKFSLVPVKKCKINGLIVDNLDYSLMQTFCPMTGKGGNLLDMNKGFTIIWGSNAGNKVYKNKTIKFSEGRVIWETDVKPDLNEMARVSLITEDENMWRKIQSLALGDQIEIGGKLVNISTDRSGRHLNYDTGLPGSNNLFWVVYVEDLNILKKASIFFNYLSWLSLLGLIAMVIIRLFGKSGVRNEY